MEVSTLRDRRLVALFATLVIGGAGVAAAVVSLERSGPYRSSAATHAALVPELSETRTADDVAPTPAPAVVVVVAEEASPAATAGAGGPAYVRGPDPCGVVEDKRGKAHDDCPKPPKPEPGAKVEKADVAPAPHAPKGVVVASEPELEQRPEPKPRHDEADDEPKPRPEPKSGPKGKGGH